MSELKTRPNQNSVKEFLESIEDPQRKKDANTLLKLFKRATGRKPVMWGDAIVGFGSYEYTNSRGTYSWLMTGFSPRKQNSTLYIMQGFRDFQQDIAALGKVKTAKSCLYITRLDNIDLERLENFLEKVVADMQQRYQCQ